MANSLFEPKIMCAHLVTIRVPDEADSEPVIANLEDISASEACIQIETAIREGADIEMICSNCQFKGKVKYCHFDSDGYDVRIAFDEQSTWTKERFEPDHLLVLSS
jgi:hypothetical protein